MQTYIKNLYFPKAFNEKNFFTEERYSVFLYLQIFLTLLIKNLIVYFDNSFFFKNLFTVIIKKGYKKVANYDFILPVQTPLFYDLSAENHGHPDYILLQESLVCQ